MGQTDRRIALFKMPPPLGGGIKSAGFMSGDYDIMLPVVISCDFFHIVCYHIFIYYSLCN